MIFQATPNIIMWFIWRRRNTFLHGGRYFAWDITNLTKRLLIKKFCYADVPKSWLHMIAILDEYRPKF